MQKQLGFFMTTTHYSIFTSTVLFTSNQRFAEYRIHTVQH